SQSGRPSPNANNIVCIHSPLDFPHPSKVTSAPRVPHMPLLHVGSWGPLVRNYQLPTTHPPPSPPTPPETIPTPPISPPSPPPPSSSTQTHPLPASSTARSNSHPPSL